MKKIFLLLLLIVNSFSYAWTLQDVLLSEGVETNIIKCDSGNVKAVYLSGDTGKYEVTPILMFDTLEEAVINVCSE